MHATKPLPRNPRYLSIPTLLAALVCAHMVQMLCEPFEVNMFFCAVLYLFGLALPIVVKRALTVRNFDDYGLGPDSDLKRLPTSRFQTTPNHKRS